MVKAINSLERRGKVIDVPQEQVTNIVVLELPAAYQGATPSVRLQFNTANEVIEVAGREMRTMSAAQVSEMVKSRTALEHKEVAHE
jgi:hypothetical protein